MNRQNDGTMNMTLPPGGNGSKLATGPQLRAARAALGWSIEHLVELTGVSRRTIYRYEATEGVPLHRGSALETLVSCLEEGGVEFIRSRKGLPGIVIRGSRV